MRGSQDTADALGKMTPFINKCLLSEKLTVLKQNIKNKEGIKEMYTYEELKSFVDNCSRCPLSGTRKKAVMGRGNLKASILFIAEAPGSSEDRDGIPFTGPSGQILDQLLTGIGMTRQDIYLTNIMKCHPPGNRDPFPEEQEACIPYLKYETLLIKPKIMVCLGRIAAQRIIDPNYRITREHGTFLYRKNTWLTAVYHPSAILRDPLKMAETKEDFKKILEKYQEIFY